MQATIGYQLLVIFLLGLRHVRSTDFKFTNSSSSLATTTRAPTFCGGCRLIYEVHASVWWPTVYTNYIATLVYTVNKDTGSTIGSGLTIPPNSTAIESLYYGVNFTSVYKLRDGGAVEYTYLNSLTNGPATTVIQYNEITMNASDYRNGYLLSTLFHNSTGTPETQCKETYYTINGSRPPGDVGLPSYTIYSYTTVVPFVEGYNMSNVITYGIDSLESYVATYLNLSVPACTSAVGGGIGTLKVGVTALTSISTFYAEAQVTLTPPPTPQPSQTPSPPSPTPPSTTPAATPSTWPSPSPEPPVQVPGSSSKTAPVISTVPQIPNAPVPSSSRGQQEFTTITATISAPSGPRTITTIFPINDDTFTATFETVITGSTGIETITSTTEIPISSYILNNGGVGTTKTSRIDPHASDTESSTTSSTLAEFSGPAHKISADTTPIFAIGLLIIDVYI